jgi:biopolymer transport protein ExbD
MAEKKTDDHEKPFINVTPLIDVLLVLLIIFMVASPLRPESFKAKVPEPLQGPQKQVAPDGLNLRVDLLKDRRMTLNGEDAGTISDMSSLIKRLSETLRDRERLGSRDATGAIARTVFIKAPRSSNYGEVAKVIDGVKTAGANPVGLQIDELEQ